MKDIYLVSTVRISIPENASERLEQVLAFMSQHCADATLTSVAAHFSFHPNTVSGLIKRETGKSFGEILREIRMQRAISLLDARVIPVAQVARLCGYENPSNFYRVFKETFGLTPRAYVRQHGGEALDDDEFGEVFVEPVGEEGVTCGPRTGAGGSPAPDGPVAGVPVAGEDASCAAVPRAAAPHDGSPGAALPRRKVRAGQDSGMSASVGGASKGEACA